MKPLYLVYFIQDNRVIPDYSALSHNNELLGTFPSLKKALDFISEDWETLPLYPCFYSRHRSNVCSYKIHKIESFGRLKPTLSLYQDMNQGKKLHLINII